MSKYCAWLNNMMLVWCDDVNIVLNMRLNYGLNNMMLIWGVCVVWGGVCEY